MQSVLQSSMKVFAACNSILSSLGVHPLEIQCFLEISWILMYQAVQSVTWRFFLALPHYMTFALLRHAARQSSHDHAMIHCKTSSSNALHNHIPLLALTAVQPMLYIMRCMLALILKPSLALVTSTDQLWLVLAHRTCFCAKDWWWRLLTCVNVLSYIISAAIQQAHCFEISCFT